MSNKFIYVMKGVSKVVGPQKYILKDIWLSFYPGAKIGVLGPNGSGKSTLLKIMAGLDKEYIGEAWPMEGIKIGYLEQEPKLDDSKNVFDNILDALKDKKALLDEFYAISNKFAEPMSDDEMNDLIVKQGELQEKIDAVDGWNIEREVEIAMDALNCPPKDADVTKISGGERRRVAICKLLLEKPDMLLLDEPTNHLDAESVAWLEQYLREYKGTVIIITHDRYFLDNVTGWILELDRGEGIPWEGNYSSWLDQKEKRLAQEEKSESDKRKALQKELEWVRQSPKARQAKSKARLAAYEKMAGEESEKRNVTSQIIIPDGPRLGQNVIDAKHLTKKFGERTVVKDLNFNIPPAAIVGIIGPNGAGKTTLFRMITGQDKDCEGEFKVGDSVKLGYVDQSRDALDSEKTVWEEISAGLEELVLGKTTMKSRAFCSAFNFKGADQQKKIDMLSGGERNRVHLAKMLQGGYNVILLDEPTNDLDVETLRALEEAILEFNGCVLVISHDRWFLDRIATHILAFEGDGHVEWFQGNFEDYEADKVRRLGEDSLKKVRFKRLSA
ncbi:MAG: energy-dependent translational throttle protein EttA [Alphaproteobacteria bacterium 33-17]|nr:MAG: energy-dependent translational throttle protein EttA [Alphaproteobacteria bacterium 33-17]